MDCLSVSYENLNTKGGSPCGEADEVSATNPQLTRPAPSDASRRSDPSQGSH